MVEARGDWTSESRPGKQLALAVGCTAVGLVLTVGFRHAGAGGDISDGRAGFFLGLLLLIIGAAGLLAQARQTVVVDPAAREIRIEDKGLFGTKRKVLFFDDIAGISVGYLGKRSNFVRMYYLDLHLKRGGSHALFAPGRFFEGASERDVVEGWRSRLEAYLRQ